MLREEKGREVTRIWRKWDGDDELKNLCFSPNTEVIKSRRMG
jgi:hypothetical protein